MTTVKELIEQLQQLDSDSIVIMSSDCEGNVYSPLDDSIGEGLYVADGPYRGEIYGDDSEGPQGKPAVVFYPIN